MWDKYTEQEAHDYAHEKSGQVEIRSYDERGNSNDAWRDSTPEEATIIETAIYAALLAIREGYNADGAKATAEFFIHTSPICETPEGRINGYGTVYIPICEFIASKEMAPV